MAAKSGAATRTGEKAGERTAAAEESGRSFMKSLLEGRLDAGLVFPYPRQNDEARETLGLVLETFREWAKDNLDGAAIDRAGVFPKTQVKELAGIGLLGMTIPEEYGGAGLPIT